MNFKLCRVYIYGAGMYFAFLENDSPYLVNEAQTQKWTYVFL